MKKKFIVFGILFLIVVFVIWQVWLNTKSLFDSTIDSTQTISLYITDLSSKFQTLRAPQSNGLINREQAIELAKLECTSFHKKLIEGPSGVDAVQVTKGEADEVFYSKKIMNGLKDPVWFVSMNGKWEIIAPEFNGETRNPIIFMGCSVILDAKTGFVLNSR